jgi:rhodanese-related sulfurtransferase
MAAETPIEIDVHEVQRLLSDEEIVLLDCREDDEYQTASIAGSKLVPMSRWNEASETLESMKGSRIVVHCHHGMRSLRVANWLRENGFPDAQSMAGGIAAWSSEIDSSVPTY